MLRAFNNKSDWQRSKYCSFGWVQKTAGNLINCINQIENSSINYLNLFHGNSNIDFVGGHLWSEKRDKHSANQ